LPTVSRSIFDQRLRLTVVLLAKRLLLARWD